jgi:hypothetical protein
MRARALSCRSTSRGSFFRKLTGVSAKHQATSVIAIFQEQMNLVYSLDGFVKGVSQGISPSDYVAEARDPRDFQDN